MRRLYHELIRRNDPEWRPTIAHQDAFRQYAFDMAQKSMPNVGISCSLLDQILQTARLGSVIVAMNILVESFELAFPGRIIAGHNDAERSELLPM